MTYQELNQLSQARLAYFVRVALGAQHTPQTADTWMDHWQQSAPEFRFNPLNDALVLRVMNEEQVYCHPEGAGFLAALGADQREWFAGDTVQLAVMRAFCALKLGVDAEAHHAGA
jgi:hypothetical protein